MLEGGVFEVSCSVLSLAIPKYPKHKLLPVYITPPCVSFLKNWRCIEKFRVKLPYPTRQYQLEPKKFGEPTGENWQVEICVWESNTETQHHCYTTITMKSKQPLLVRATPSSIIYPKIGHHLAGLYKKSGRLGWRWDMLRCDRWSGMIQGMEGGWVGWR